VGADDYVVKPFSPRELVARVRAILRRAHEPADVSSRRIGELEVDESRHSVTVEGTSVELTAKEFGLLCALIRANGRVLNREQLLEGVWGYADAAEIESRTVDVHIRRLREKLGVEAKRIVTVKGVGYRFDMEG
jgi:DNA-binding response OmpR family regulator